MDEDRFDLRLEQFERAVAALHLVMQQPENEFIRDSIIKRFELAFESGRKCLRQWLIDQQELPATATKKEIMDAAYRVGLLGDAELWTEIVRLRNDSSHEYNAQRALEAVAFVRACATDAFDALLAALKSKAQA